MPNRILRPWLDSEAVNSLSDAAEVFFVRLIMSADDYGRFHGAPILLKSYLYPLKKKRVSDIPHWIAECVNAGLIVEYEVNGKRYLQIVNFSQPEPHEASLFPSPDDAQGSREKEKGSPPHPLSKEVERRVNSSNSARTRKREKIYFDYEGDGKLHGITREQLDYWIQQLPAIDVEEELRRASSWLDGNRRNRKYDVKRFLVNWLLKAQDRAKQTFNRDTKDYTGL